MIGNIAEPSGILNPKPSSPNLKRKRQTSVDSTPHTSRDLTVSFHVGKELRQTSQSSFLSYVWNTGLDSDCVSCGQPFEPNEAPPIRTIGLEKHPIPDDDPRLLSGIDITQDIIAPWNLRIFNRHLACIKANKISYVPISHAWHENVAAAQDGHVESREVSKIVYQTPVKTLLAIVAEFSNEVVEIWHDYLSVPQWRTNVQARLLLAIPEIYSYATRTVIHLDDVRAVHVSSQGGGPKSESYDDFIVNFAATIRSRWFDRMWVTLEYLQSNDVVILTEDYTICDVSARDLCQRLDTTHGMWVKQRSNSDVTRDIWKQNTTLKRMTSWIDMEAWKNERTMHRTLGWAIGILGHRQCRQSRDYFLALGKMLDFRPEQDPLVLVQDRFQYFLCLAVHALRRGDYTPLLFIPPPDEQVDGRAPWLRGFSTVSWKLWDMGRCHRKATREQIIRNGKIEPELETAGIIEWFEYFDFEGTPESVLDYVASRAVQAQGRDPGALCESMERVFPLDERKAANMEWEDVVAAGKGTSAGMYDLPKIRTLLEDYGLLLEGQGSEKATTTRRRLDIAKKMVTALKLGKRGKHARESRLETAAGEADWFLREYGKTMEGIARIRCKICGRRSLCRLTMWEQPTADVAQVYRIAGLLYDDTVPEGVGIVVQDQRVLGKTMYGTPACECRRLEMVDLGLLKV